MSSKAEKIVSEALELPTTVRAFLAEKLIESLDIESGGELSPEWKEEIEKRCREIDEGSAQLLDAEAVFSKAYSSLP